MEKIIIIALHRDIIMHWKIIPYTMHVVQVGFAELVSKYPNIHSSPIFIIDAKFTECWWIPRIEI